ncbi:hypothetical protein CLAIMM_14176 [Cladophialophora immunda]|nr:hypothetical protein CLAIMM_14176 [Cladophialophora immunda]
MDFMPGGLISCFSHGRNMCILIRGHDTQSDHYATSHVPIHGKKNHCPASTHSLQPRDKKESNMCEQLCRQYRLCNHRYTYDYVKCKLALARPWKAVCVPPSGYMRDLPRALDVQDLDLPGLCPYCAGRSPRSSQASQ